jgi:hypothetical protein
LLHASRRFELLASSYEQCVSNRLSRTPPQKEMTRPGCPEERTSAAKAVKRVGIMARLKPCPSFDGVFPSVLGSVKASGAVQIGQLKNSNFEQVWLNLAQDASPGLD